MRTVVGQIVELTARHSDWLVRGDLCEQIYHLLLLFSARD